MTFDVDLECLAEVVCVRFLLQTVLSIRKPLSAATLKEQEVMESIYINFLNSSAPEISPLCIYSVTYFYQFGLHSILLYFSAHCFSFAYWETNNNNQQTFFFFFLTSSSLLSGTTRGSRFIFCIYCPSPRISHVSKEPYFVLLDNVLQTMIWVLGMCTATGFCPLS